MFKGTAKLHKQDAPTTCTNMTEAEAVQTPEPQPTTLADDQLIHEL
ncbi:hypothetical protein [Streptomyces sp. NPDC087538]